MQTSNLKFTLLTVVTVMSIIACSNNNGKLAVTPRGSTSPSQSACVDSLKSSQQMKVGGKRSVAVCQLPITAPSTATPVAVNHPVSYSVYGGDDPAAKRSSNKVHLKMLVGFEETKQTIDKTKRQKFADLIGEDCGVAIAKIFERSVDNGMQLALNLNYTVIDPTSNNDGIGEPDSNIPDDTLSITQVAESGDVFWQVDQLPSRPRFFGKARSTDEKACEGDPVGTQNCKNLKRKAANIPFCAALAKRVGNTLGLVNAEGEKAMCGAEQPAPVTTAATPEGTATPLPEAATDAPGAMVEDASFEMNEAGDLNLAAKPNPSSGDSSFSKPTGKDDDWLGKATLNHKDVVTIMSPVCKDMK